MRGTENDEVAISSLESIGGVHFLLEVGLIQKQDED